MSSRNDDQETPPEKENNAGSSLDHKDDIELGRVSPPTKLDFSRLNETKIAKREMEKNKPIRPDWLWEKRADGSYEYWTRDKVEIRAYIEYLERLATDARRKMDDVIFTLQGKTGTASKRAEYAVEQITKIMEMLDVDPVVKHELPCIWPNDDRVKCNGYCDGNCAMPIRREEICKDIPKDPIGEEGERPKVLVPAGHSDCEVCHPPEEPPEELKECCQKEKERDQFSATCPECKSRLPRPDGIKCWLDEDQRDRPWPPGAPAIGDRYIPYATEDLEKVVK